MSPQLLSLILFLLLAALYLPVIATLLRRREGQETASLLLTAYLSVALLLTIVEGLRYGGRWQAGPQAALDIQIYGALLLSVLMILTIIFFVRREIWTWLGIGVFWGLVVIAALTNIFRLGEVVWTNGAVTLTRAGLAPAISALGWVVFSIGALAVVRSAHAQSRQP